MKLTIDTDTIIKLKQDGKKFCLEAESEEAIVELLKLQQTIRNISTTMWKMHRMQTPICTRMVNQMCP